jgi:diketogulonate reductase-like aldo/keto reductase
LIDQARENELVLIAYCPLARGVALEEKTVRQIAHGHGRDPSQIVLRWHMQQDPVAAIPRSQDSDHIGSNFRVFDFELSDDEMQAISGLARGMRKIDPDWAPAWRK